MRKFSFKISSLVIAVLLLSTIFYGCKKSSSNDVVKVRLNEVVRSVFYAPMYVAINEGFFKEEGIEIDLTIG